MQKLQKEETASGERFFGETKEATVVRDRSPFVTLQLFPILERIEWGDY
jgi:hypothetical protein